MRNQVKLRTIILTAILASILTVVFYHIVFTPQSKSGSYSTLEDIGTITVSGGVLHYYSINEMSTEELKALTVLSQEYVIILNLTSADADNAMYDE